MFRSARQARTSLEAAAYRQQAHAELGEARVAFHRLERETVAAAGAGRGVGAPAAVGPDREALLPGFLPGPRQVERAALVQEPFLRALGAHQVRDLVGHVEHGLALLVGERQAHRRRRQRSELAAAGSDQAQPENEFLRRQVAETILAAAGAFEVDRAEVDLEAIVGA